MNDFLSFPEAGDLLMRLLMQSMSGGGILLSFRIYRVRESESS